MKDRIYIFGLILVILSFIACTVSYYQIYFAFPVFIIGAIIVLFSKNKLYVKLITIVAPLILYLPSTYLFLLAYNYTSPKTFLIPADYEGTIRIVFEEKCGVTLDKENGRQILQFPESGILILNEKFDGGINNDYYFVDKNGGRTKIEQVINYKNRAKKLPSILIGGAGTIGGDTESEDITHSDFYIYNKDTSQTDDYRLSHRFDSVTTEIVKACRMK